MKKIIIITMLLISIDKIYAGNLYVSKRDIDTKEYINDCDFLLYDENNIVVDAWMAENDIHKIDNIKNGKYTLEERPKIENGISRDLSVFHEIEINDNTIEVVLYNSKMETPKNLNYSFKWFSVGCVIIFIGIYIIYIGYRKYYIN